MFPWWKRVVVWAGLAFGLLATCLPGCAAPQVVRATRQQLSARASFELSCHPRGLQLVPLGPGVAGVVGCGRRLTYVERCEQLQATRQCFWELNSNGSVTPEPVAPWPSSLPGPTPAATGPTEPPRPHVLDGRK